MSRARLRHHDRAVRLGSLPVPGLPSPDRVGSGGGAGQREAPTWVDPVAVLLQQRGLDHERGYVERLRAEGSPSSISPSTTTTTPWPVRSTPCGRARRHPSACASNGRWFGRPDVLRRVETPSAFGPWSYRGRRHKAREGNARRHRPSARALLRASRDRSGRHPRDVSRRDAGPGYARSDFRVQDFAAYFRLDPRSARGDLAAGARSRSPPRTTRSRWSTATSAAGGATATSDGATTITCRSSPASRGSRAESSRPPASARWRSSARFRCPAVHAAARRRRDLRPRARAGAGSARGPHPGRRPSTSCCRSQPDQGLARLPAPSPGDIFLDLEGDPFARDGGREYLFGLVIVGTDGPRRTARILGLLGRRGARRVRDGGGRDPARPGKPNPGMHVYHYAPYEPAAFKRLMGRHATREAEIDRMLRAGLFVDLYAVVKHSLRASVESYSIKDLEPFYGFTRTVALARCQNQPARGRTRARARRRGRRSPTRSVPRSKATTATIASRPCASATGWSGCALRSKPEGHRCRGRSPGRRRSGEARRARAPGAGADGGAHGRRSRGSRASGRGAAGAMAARASARLASARGQGAVVGVLPACAISPRRSCSTRSAALSGLQFVRAIGGTHEEPIDRYSYPPQDTDVREDDDAASPGRNAFRERRGHRSRRSHGRRQEARRASRRSSLRRVRTLRRELRRAGRGASAHRAMTWSSTAFQADTQYRAARELLLGRPPRLRSGAFEANGRRDAPSQFAIRIAADLDDTVLAIQGPRVRQDLHRAPR